MTVGKQYYLDEAQRARIVQLHDIGLTQAVICARIGVAKATVAKVLEKAGRTVPRKTRTEAR